VIEDVKESDYVPRFKTIFIKHSKKKRCSQTHRYVEGITFKELIAVARNLDIFPTLMSHREIKDFFELPPQETMNEAFSERKKSVESVSSGILMSFDSFIQFFHLVAEKTYEKNAQATDL